MAANEQEKPKPDIAKLKELEASLAKELDQRVRLSEPTDPRLEGHVDVNPSMADALQKAKESGQNKIIAGDEKAAAAAAGAATGTATGTAASATSPPAAVPSAAPGAAGQPDLSKHADDISLQEVDELLDQFDAGFKDSLKAMSKEVGTIEAPTGLESLPISSDYLKTEDGKDTTEAVAALPLPTLGPGESAFPKRFFPALKKVTVSALEFPWRVTKNVVKPLTDLPRLKAAPRDTLIFAVGEAIQPWANLKEDFRLFWILLKSTPRRNYYIFAAFIVIASMMAWLVRDIAKNFSPDQARDPFLRNFNDVADSVQVIPEDRDGEDLESPLRHPEYVVLVHRLIANLKAPNEHQSPMVAMEFYIEASSQDAAVELHDREPEVRDIVERVLEDTTFDELDTKPGKDRLKVRMRAGVNRILNKGQVKRVFFKSLNIHQ